MSNFETRAPGQKRSVGHNPTSPFPGFEPDIGAEVFLRPANCNAPGEIVVRVASKDHSGVFTGLVVSFTDHTEGLESPLGYRLDDEVTFTEQQVQHVIAAGH